MRKKNNSWLYSILEKPWAKVSTLGFLIVSILLILIPKFINEKKDNLETFGNINVGEIKGNNNNLTNNISVNEYKNKLPDSVNCLSGENWCGMSQPEVNFYGKTLIAKNNNIFSGEFRWSPIINGIKQTSEGEIYIIVEDKKELICKWDNPTKAIQEFTFPIKLLENYKGKYNIKWKYINGSSGFCIMKSEIK